MITHYYFLAIERIK